MLNFPVLKADDNDKTTSPPLTRMAMIRIIGISWFKLPEVTLQLGLHCSELDTTL